MKQRYLIVFLFVITLFSNLEALSRSTPINDRLSELNRLSKLHPDSVDHYFQKILSTLAEVDYKLKDTLIWGETDRYFYFLENHGDYEKIKKLCSSLLKNNKSNSRIYADLLTVKGNYLHIMGDFDHAIDTFKLSLSIFQSLKDAEKIQIGYHNVGVAYFSKGDYLNSTKYLVNALRQGSSDSAYLFQSYSMMGMNYLRLDNLKLAKEYLEQAKNYTMGRSDFEMGRLIYLSKVYRKEGDYENTINSLLSAKEVLLKSGESYPHFLVSIYFDLAGAHLNSHQLKLAEAYYDSTIVIAKKNLYNPFLLSAYDGKGEVCYDKKKYTQAIDYFLLGLKLAKESSDFVFIQRLEFNLSKTYALLGNYKKAHEYLNDYIVTKDSVFNIEKNKQILEVSEKYETEKKEQAIKILAKDKSLLLAQKKLDKLALNQSNTRNQNLILIASLFALAICFLLFYLRNKSKKNKEKLMFMDQEYQLKKVEAKFEGQEKERNRLSSELHDGIASSILMLKMSLSEKQKELKEELNSIYQEMRTISHDLKSPYFGELESIDEMTKYLIKDSLLINRISVEYLWYPSNKTAYFNDKNKIIFYRVLQEIFTNIIKHANAQKVEISYTFHEDLNLMITDDGQGFETNDPEWRRGVGIQNIYTRIEMLQGKVSINSAKNKGTVVMIDIPSSMLLKHTSSRENQTEMKKINTPKRGRAQKNE